MIQVFFFAMQEALASFRRTRVMVIISIGIIAMSLLLVGVFLLITQNVSMIIKAVQEKVEVVAYAADSFAPEAIQKLRGQIQGLSSVQEVKFVSKEEALEQFKRDFADRKDLLTALTTNPLPASFQIRLDSYQSEIQVAAVADSVAQMSGITEVIYGKEWLHRLDQVFVILRWTSLISGAIIAFAAIFVIYNTIKLTVYSRREAIQIMQFVGATAWMIRLPFMLEAMIQGIFGAGISLLLLYTAYFQAAKYLPEGFSLHFIAPEFVLGLLFLGILLGGIGSWISIRRFLEI